MGGVWGEWGVCVSMSVYVLEGGGWSECMCNTYFKCVRKYARVSTQCLLHITVMCTDVLVYVRAYVSVCVRACVRACVCARARVKSNFLKLLFWCNLLTYVIILITVRSV